MYWYISIFANEQVILKFESVRDHHPNYFLNINKFAFATNILENLRAIIQGNRIIGFIFL